MLKLKKYVYVWQVIYITLVGTIIYYNMRRSKQWPKYVRGYYVCNDKIPLYTYVHLLISLPYVISSMYSHRLLKKFVFKGGGPGSIPSQPMGDSWWKKWNYDRFSLVFTLSVSFLQSSKLNFIYLLLLTGQTSEAWGPS